MTVLTNVSKVDLSILLWCTKSHYYQRFISFVRAVSKTGDGYMQVMLPIVITVISGFEQIAFLVLVAKAYLIERPLYFVLKNTLKRRRPPEVEPSVKSIVTPSDQFSFPSGHTMAAFLLASLATIEFGAIASILYLWASMVGASRVILSVHFPTDILAGAAIGTGLAIILV